ncbi:MAG: hypothetical protein ACFFEY_05410 [Candidatus Thorarchaeota archaeon]
MKQSDNKKPVESTEFKESSTLNKNSFLPSNYFENAIKNLANPRFLGSFHLKKEMRSPNNSVENLVENELTGKINKSLKSTLFNPITKILIIAAIMFYFFWFLFVYIL